MSKHQWQSVPRLLPEEKPVTVCGRCGETFIEAGGRPCPRPEQEPGPESADKPDPVIDSIATAPHKFPGESATVRRPDTIDIAGRVFMAVVLVVLAAAALLAYTQFTR